MENFILLMENKMNMSRTMSHKKQSIFLLIEKEEEKMHSYISNSLNTK
jgi:hypothetical protein